MLLAIVKTQNAHNVKMDIMLMIKIFVRLAQSQIAWFALVQTNALLVIQSTLLTKEMEQHYAVHAILRTV